MGNLSAQKRIIRVYWKQQTRIYKRFLQTLCIGLFRHCAYPTSWHYQRRVKLSSRGPIRYSHPVLSGMDVYTHKLEPWLHPEKGMDHIWILGPVLGALGWMDQSTPGFDFLHNIRDFQGHPHVLSTHFAKGISSAHKFEGWDISHRISIWKYPTNIGWSFFVS